MIIEKKTSTTGTLTGKSFTIETSGKAFEILSSKIYKNKLAAILREIGSNAWDSHKKAKITTPIDVTLPSPIDSNLTIRDFGSGIGEKNIYKIYTTYFSSTKSSTNDQVGAFGLGSKSPLCYTDSFIINDFHGKVKKTYAVFLNNGVPQITKTGEENTTETGFEVVIPIKKKDFKETESLVNTIYQYYDPPVRIVGTNTLIGMQSVLKFVDTKQWFVSNSRHTNGVLIGPNFYPSNTCSCVLLADIGTVDVTASRESLEMTTKTKNTLKVLHKKSVEDRISLINKAISDFPIDGNLRQRVDNICYQYGIGRSDKIHVGSVTFGANFAKTIVEALAPQYSNVLKEANTTIVTDNRTMKSKTFVYRGRDSINVPENIYNEVSRIINNDTEHFGKNLYMIKITSGNIKAKNNPTLPTLSSEIEESLIKCGIKLDSSKYVSPKDVCYNHRSEVYKWPRLLSDDDKKRIINMYSITYIKEWLAGAKIDMRQIKDPLFIKIYNTSTIRRNGEISFEICREALMSLEKAIFNKYPLACKNGYYSSESLSQDIIEYLNMKYDKGIRLEFLYDEGV